MSELLTISEVADALRVDTTTVRRWISLGAMPAVILPHVNSRQIYRVRRDTINEILGTPAVTTQDSDTIPDLDPFGVDDEQAL